MTFIDYFGKVSWQYKYDRNGWITQKIFKFSASTSIPTYRAIYEYDERGQIARERFEKYDEANKVMQTVLDVTYEYDLAGNITKKNYSDGSYMSYTYSIGYQMTGATDGTSTWTFSYDANGNMTERRLGIVVDFQGVYDERNRLQEYRFRSVGNYNSIEYDGIGRVWKRTDDTSAESFYYHTGTKLAQELDDSNGVTVDYMAGSRRYMPNEEEDNYRYYAKDHLGSVVMMTDRDAGTGGLTAEFYTYDSWGEHADTAAVPSTLNNIRYAGGRVEFFADGTAEGAVYLCGERHYMPMYGRFLQRDRLTYEKLPSPTNPLSANPYIYAENNPVMKKDINGLQPSGYYRGATMGGKTVIIGTQMPPEAQIYDCCGGGYHSLDATEVSFSLIHSTRLPGSGQAGFIDFTRLSKNADWGGSLCDANPNEGQPNERCPETTTATSDLLCTYVERCMGGSCPGWNHLECPKGMVPVDVGYDSNPLWGGIARWWENLWYPDDPLPDLVPYHGSFSTTYSWHQDGDFWLFLQEKVTDDEYDVFINKVLPNIDNVFYANPSYHRGEHCRAWSQAFWDQFRTEGILVSTISRPHTQLWNMTTEYILAGENTARDIGAPSNQGGGHYRIILSPVSNPDIRIPIDPQEAAGGAWGSRSVNDMFNYWSGLFGFNNPRPVICCPQSPRAGFHPMYE